MERVFRGVDIFCFVLSWTDGWIHGCMEWNGTFISFYYFFLLFSSPTRWSVVLGATYHTVDVVGAGVRVVIQSAVLGSWDAGRDGFCSVLLQPASRERVPVCDARLRCSAYAWARWLVTVPEIARQTRSGCADSLSVGVRSVCLRLHLRFLLLLLPLPLPLSVSSNLSSASNISISTSPSFLLSLFPIPAS